MIRFRGRHKFYFLPEDTILRNSLSVLLRPSKTWMVYSVNLFQYFYFVYPNIKNFPSSAHLRSRDFGTPDIGDMADEYVKYTDRDFQNWMNHLNELVKNSITVKRM